MMSKPNLILDDVRSQMADERAKVQIARNDIAGAEKQMQRLAKLCPRDYPPKEKMHGYHAVCSACGALSL